MPHEGGGLADRAAGVGAQRERREPGRDGRRRAAATSRPARARGPTGCGSGRSRSARSTSPSRTRPCSSCRPRPGRPPRVRSTTSASTIGRKPSRMREPAVVGIAARGQHVLERDRHALQAAAAARVELARARERLLRVHVQEGVHVAVVRRDALQVRRGQLLGRDARARRAAPWRARRSARWWRSPPSLTPDRRHAEALRRGVGRVQQGVLVRGGRVRLVRRQHVDEVERVRRRRHAREVELARSATRGRGCATSSSRSRSASPSASPRRASRATCRTSESLRAMTARMVAPARPLFPPAGDPRRGGGSRLNG